MAVVTVRHKGLRRLFERNDARGINASHADKLRDMLQALDAAATIEQMATVPGWRLHPLKGDLKGYWSLTVTANWRLIFRFQDGDVFELDLIDYH